MCGIFGILTSSPDAGALEDDLKHMVPYLRHRGPDGSSTWINESGTIGLGHTRLSIVDLGESGAQPMRSESHRYVISFNGEIYNHREIRSRLVASGAQFRGTSDTEVFLGLIDSKGLHDALSQACGMFAFALVDRRTGTVTLGRDRVGEKPLYYALQHGNVIFGSEIQALQKSRYWSGAINRDALAQLVYYGYIPTPHTIFDTVQKLSAGTLLTLANNQSGWRGRETRWWSYDDLIAHNSKRPTPRTKEKVVDEFDFIINSVVEEQTSADVPVGSLLSGGIDSTIVTIAAAKNSDRPISTFTIGYKESSHDESTHARKIAEYLGTDHHEKIVSQDDGLQAINELPSIYSEPFADYSQIPTSLVCRFARQHVKATLTGDGADEIFFGYNRYRWGPKLFALRKYLGQSAGVAAKYTFKSLAPGAWDKIFSLSSRTRDIPQPGDKLYRIADLLALDNPEMVYSRLLHQWNGASPVIGGDEQNIPMMYPHYWSSEMSFSEIMRHIDAQTYLPDDILVKTDRASMAVGLETRSPFLDLRILLFAYSLPASFLQQKNTSKWLLREWLRRHVPESLYSRPKMGFSFPLASWLRGPLKAWASEKLDEEKLLAQGYFDPKPIRAKWANHLSGRCNTHAELWPILVFQGWLEQYGKSL
jgi:asparagine synthase (glutamine-hydrolysing)